MTAAANRLLPLVEFSDLELLHVIADNSTDDGEISSATVAGVLECKRQAVGSRFGWLVRFGVLEHYGSGYRMSDAGRSIYYGQITAAQKKVLTALGKGDHAVAAMDALMTIDTLDPAIGTVVRRQFRYRDSRRRR